MNEISFNASLGASKNGAQVNGAANGNVTMAGNAMIENVQTIGTDPEQILLGDVATPAMLLLINLDPANFVEISLDIGMTKKFAKLLPGEPCGPFRPSSAAIYAQADGAPISLAVTTASV